MAEAVTVLLIDDQPLFVQYLLRFLGTEPRIEIVGVAHKAEEAVTLSQALQPEVILLDLSMPGQSGMDVLPKIREAAPHSYIIVLTSHDSEWYQDQARRRGADAFVSKHEVLERLVQVILERPVQ
ncbi:response regulator [Rhodothermus marinus]|uniref:Response regulator receiver protein n=1 Tax=Rhodothermus marinus (strain ATCC 43812 / DSM 4252 / R-10) TaxID=518766 RepID=D0MF58_RHOM4|nr:response regulator transcription factor [Rhodothermus marinus]ACY49314.1 response regulator receiver protein [Rhodothermus marinus DSM 4252]